jgi:hypothetical protein
VGSRPWLRSSHQRVQIASAAASII